MFLADCLKQSDSKGTFSMSVPCLLQTFDCVMTTAQAHAMGVRSLLDVPRRTNILLAREGVGDGVDTARHTFSLSSFSSTAWRTYPAIVAARFRVSSRTRCISSLGMRMLIISDSLLSGGRPPGLPWRIGFTSMC